MLLVKAIVKDSDWLICESGLYAEQFIHGGSKIWNYNPNHTPIADLEKVNAVNHSEYPNVDQNFYAIRDIPQNEEIVINYRQHGIPVYFDVLAPTFADFKEKS